jgi:hypothetical protein
MPHSIASTSSCSRPTEGLLRIALALALAASLGLAVAERASARPDVWKVQHGNTGSGKTELHIMDGDSTFTTFLGHPVTADPPMPDSNHEYAVADYNSDGRLTSGRSHTAARPPARPSCTSWTARPTSAPSWATR